MMVELSPFPLSGLIAPAATIFVIGFMVALLATRQPHWSFFAAALKSSLFILYYAVFFNGMFSFKDDWTYLDRGGILLDQGISVANMFAHLPELFSQAGGKHFVYYLFNADSFRLFGQAYYSPVALNIILTFLTATFMTAAVRKGLGLSKNLCVGLFIFVALHPDILVWSTIMNGKDNLVLAGTAMVVYAVSLAGERRYGLATLLAAVVFFVLFFTRFYIPLLFLVALSGALLTSSTGRRRRGLWLLVPAGLAVVVSVLGWNGLVDAYDRLQAGFVNPLYGFPRFVLTPIPFHTTKHYAFLNLPQVFHWAMMPFLIYGIYRVWQRATLMARFIVIYFALMILLYGMFDNLQGPRHRVQFDGIIAVFQFFGVVGMLNQILAPNSQRAPVRPDAFALEAK